MAFVNVEINTLQRRMLALQDMTRIDEEQRARRKSDVEATIAGVADRVTAIETALTHLRYGAGAPDAGLGANGDYYFRSDGGVATHIYFKSAGAWAGII